MNYFQPNLPNLPCLLKQPTNHYLNLLLIKHNLQTTLAQEISLNLALRKVFTMTTSLQQCQKSSEHLEAPSLISSLNCSSTFGGSEFGFKKIRQKTKKIKNDTKNIPKNFGKAIIAFIQQREQLVRKLFNNSSKDHSNFLKALRCKKQSINSIAELRSLWLQEEFQYSR